MSTKKKKVIPRSGCKRNVLAYPTQNPDLTGRSGSDPKCAHWYSLLNPKSHVISSSEPQIAMAFSSAIRRAASSAAPFVARSIALRRINFHSAAAAATAALHRRTLDGFSFCHALRSRNDLILFPQRSHFSAQATKLASDSELVKVIESEIKCAEECDDHDRVISPRYFPLFRIFKCKLRRLIM